MRAPVKILNVVGARPTFVKIAPLVTEMERQPGIRPILVHTGPYYREAMSDQCFSELHIRQPDFDLGVAWGSRATRIAEIIKRIEPVMDEVRPDLVLVVGDVDATLAAALTAVKLGVRVAHVEAGLRSFDRTTSDEHCEPRCPTCPHLWARANLLIHTQLSRESTSAFSVTIWRHPPGILGGPHLVSHRPAG